MATENVMGASSLVTIKLVFKAKGVDRVKMGLIKEWRMVGATMAGGQ